MAAKKKKSKPFRAATAVKAASREAIGIVPRTRTEPADKRRKPAKEKHKPALHDLLRDDTE